MDLILKSHKMDFKGIIINAARDGRLHRLKVFLDHKSAEEVSFLVSAGTNGATPLLMACTNGHLDVAVYLIERCHADIEQVGSVTFDGKVVEGASPLWCAAAARHLNIVKMLVKHKASVNSTTNTNSTPLRAACFRGHFDIVKYLIRHGANIEIANEQDYTCLMIACSKGHYEISKYLLECGADINRKCVKGNTALHDCAESGSLGILKMLLQNGAKSDCNSLGITPLLSAAVAGHSQIVEYFLNEFNCSKQDKVNALELLGATFIDKKYDIAMALQCWKRAMELRYEDGESPLEKPISKFSIASYVDTAEVRTLNQLEEIISDPDEIKMQALLARERILGTNNPYTIHYSRYRGAIYIKNGNFERSIKLWMYALDAQQKFKEPLSSVTQNSLLSFIELFSYMMSDDLPFARGFPPVSFQDILHVFQRALKEIETALYVSTTKKDSNYRSQFHDALILAMHLLGFMCRLQPYLNKVEDIELKKAAYKLVHLNPKGRNRWTPLHLACSRDTTSYLDLYHSFKFPSSEVVDLLLEVGACPNAVDVSNNTPLHVAAMKSYDETIIKALLNHGAHLDLCNSKKITPLQLVEAIPYLNVYPLCYINLQCLCAQTIRKHEIAYEGIVHEKLNKFLYSH